MLAATVYLSVYLCRETFLTPSTGHWQSMHGEWLAIARTAGSSGWLLPHWYRFQAAGGPLEYLYAPVVPFLLTFLDFNRVTGGVYVLGPAVVFFVLWRLLRSPWPAVLAALCYMLLSPTELFLPDARVWNPAMFFSARRFYLLWDWDELPHLIAITLVPVLALLLLRARTRAAVFCAALMMAASMFGLVLSWLTAAAVALATESGWKRCAAVPLLAWLLVSPWIPPSLLWTIRRNSAFNAEVPPEARALLAFGLVLVATAAVWWASRPLRPEIRWILLFACPVILIPVLFQYAQIWFIPQAGRYKVEAEFAVALLVGLALHAVYRRAPVWLSVALTLPLLWVLGQQVVAHRRFAKAMLKPVLVESRIEYRAARWIEINLPGQRVMLSGSMAQWADAFADVDQLGGFSYPTVPNLAQQLAVNEQHWGRDPGASIEWLRRFGVTAVAVPGPKSPEFWKPYQNPGKYEGVLKVLWREDDTTIYAVPGPRSPLQWRDRDHATFTGSGLVDVGINAMPGWQASRGVIRKNEFGLMQIDTGCSQPCTVELTYRGSTEAWVLRLVSLGTLVLLGRRRW